MTLSTTSARTSYSANGSTTAFTVPFVFFRTADLKVYVRSAAGVETLKSETTHYTVSGAGDPAGGTVTFGIAPASGETVVILRDPPATQETDYQENDKFGAETHERALDKLTMLVQRLGDRIARTVTFRDSSPTVNVALPEPVAGQFLRWASSLTALENASVSGGGSGGAVSSVAGRTGDVVLSKNDVGLGNVDNVADAGKPVSTAVQTALDAKEPLGETTALNTQTGTAYTLALADKGKIVETNNAGANTLTVPPNSSIAFPIKTRIDLVQFGAGQTTIAAGSGVTIRSAGAKLKLTGQYSAAALYKRATDEWVLVGDLSS